jgi:hypothetical protein
MDDMQAKLLLLLDRQEIGDLIIRYGFSFDRRDWDLHRSCFTDEIQMDFSASLGGSGLTTYKADEWVELVKPFFMNLEATQHIAMPLSININGDEAMCISMLHAQHYLPNEKGESIQRMIGYYENFLLRTSQGWKINKMIQHINWNEGNWYIFELAAGMR